MKLSANALKILRKRYLKKEEVKEAILLAYRSELKGLTAYRQGSRAREALSYCGYPHCIP